MVNLVPIMPPIQANAMKSIGVMAYATVSNVIPFWLISETCHAYALIVVKAPRKPTPRSNTVALVASLFRLFKASTIPREKAPVALAMNVPTGHRFSSSVSLNAQRASAPPAPPNATMMAEMKFMVEPFISFAWLFCRETEDRCPVYHHVEITRVIAGTNNLGKIREFSDFFSDFHLTVVPIGQIIPNFAFYEPQLDTLQPICASKLQQATDALSKKINPSDILLVEDAGLFISSLSDFPGPYSAYFYSKLGCEGILSLLKNERDRSARFEAVIGIAINGTQYFFNGVCNGKISSYKMGQFGFGFDPIFVPSLSSTGLTFGEDPSSKNEYSHRTLALSALQASWTDLVRDIDPNFIA